MRIVVHGQQAFGKAVLEALLKRGENVVAGDVPDQLNFADLARQNEAQLAVRNLFVPHHGREQHLSVRGRELRRHLRGERRGGKQRQVQAQG